ncbi:TPA: hypothetical protein DF272_01470 [Candidatus Falkowbacteria bacterium]|nr:hypothetical protein [Candidatus Falkowbacteria bacterium]
MQKSHKIRLVISYLFLVAAYAIYFGYDTVLFSLLLTVFGLSILMLGLVGGKPKLRMSSPGFVWRRRKEKSAEEQDLAAVELSPETAEVEVRPKTSADIKNDLQEITKVWKELEEDK